MSLKCALITKLLTISDWLFSHSILHISLEKNIWYFILFLMFYLFFDAIYAIFDWSNSSSFFEFDTEINFKSINFTNVFCFWNDKILMKSSIKMLVVKIHWILIVFFCIFWRNQWRCISTWRNLMINLIAKIMKIRIIWRLSHWMWMNFFMFICIDSKKRFHHILMLIVIDIINNSISMKLMIIVFCFVIFQSMKSSKNIKQYSFEFWRMFKSFANDAFEKFKKMIITCFVWFL